MELPQIIIFTVLVMSATAALVLKLHSMSNRAWWLSSVTSWLGFAFAPGMVAPQHALAMILVGVVIATVIHYATPTVYGYYLRYREKRRETLRRQRDNYRRFEEDQDGDPRGYPL